MRAELQNLDRDELLISEIKRRVDDPNTTSPDLFDEPIAFNVKRHALTLPHLSLSPRSITPRSPQLRILSEELHGDYADQDEREDLNKQPNDHHRSNM